jgi:hypothetical protein
MTIMNRLKILAAFLALAALGRAESTLSSDRVIQLPPVIVEASRLPSPVIDVRPALAEATAQANLTLQSDMRHVLGRSFRRLVAEQRRPAALASVAAGKPNA